MSSWSNSFHISMGCDFFYDCFCDQCEQDGLNVEAKGYCCTCKTYLCADCYAAHLRPHARRHHVLDESEMPKSQPHAHDKNICVETCPIHPEMKMSYVCYSHREFGCKDCMEQKHQNCRGVDYIPDVADEIVESGEFGEFHETMTKLKKKAHISLQAIKTNVEHTRSLNNTVHEAMHQFRDDVMDALDIIERSVISETEEMSAENEQRMKVSEGQIKEILQTIETIDSRFTALKAHGQLCQLFMALKRAPFEIAGLESRLTDRCKEAEVQKYTFKISEQAHAFLQSPERMVKIEKTCFEKEALGRKREDVCRRDMTKPAVVQRKDIDNHRDINRRVSRRPGELHAGDRDIQDEAHECDDGKQGADHKHESGNTGEVRKRDSNNQENISVPGGGDKEVHRRDSGYRGQERGESASRSGLPRTIIRVEKKEKQGEFHMRNVANKGNRGNSDSDNRQGRDDAFSQVTDSQGSSELLLKQSSSGAAVQSGADSTSTAVEHIMDINVRTESDKDTPDITSSILMPGGKLVVVDLNNSKVKMIDLAYIAVTAELEVPLPIWDITQVSNSKAAVLSFQNNVIYVVNVTDNLTLDTTISTRGPCGGISCIDNTFLVCSESMEVQVISMTGQVLRTLVTEEHAAALFIEPEHLAVDPRHQSVYVSDIRQDSVTVLDFNGEVKAVYKDLNLKGPYKLAVTESGFVYICGFDSNNIHRVSADLSEQQVVLQRSDGIARPQTISCCDVTGNMYVGMCRSEVLKVYQILNDSY